MKLGRLAGGILCACSLIAPLVWLPARAGAEEAATPTTRSANRPTSAPAATTNAVTLPADLHVVCVGNSITRGGYPELLAATLGCRVTNAGKNGETTKGAMARFTSDVIERKPDAVVILYGTNDSRLAEPKVHVPLDAFQTNLVEMIRACKAAHADVVVCTVPPINPEPYYTRHDRTNFDAAGGMEKVLATYRDAAITVAQQEGAAVLDLNRILAERPSWMGRDGVHPTAEGKQIIADEVAEVLRSILQRRAETRGER